MDRTRVATYQRPHQLTQIHRTRCTNMEKQVGKLCTLYNITEIFEGFQLTALAAQTWKHIGKLD